MIRSCNNCKKDIAFKSFYKQTWKNSHRYTCAECGAVHKATMVSVILYAIIFIVPFICLIGELKLYIASIAWSLIAIFIIQPFILQYK